MQLLAKNITDGNQDKLSHPNKFFLKQNTNFLRNLASNAAFVNYLDKICKILHIIDMFTFKIENQRVI